MTCAERRRLAEGFGEIRGTLPSFVYEEFARPLSQKSSFKAFSERQQSGMVTRPGFQGKHVKITYV